MSDRGNLMQNKAMDFAIRIVKLCKWLREEKKAFVLSKQLIRSGTSIGANLAEAQAAISRADFTAKVYISAKECRETQYWLELLHRTALLDDKQYDSINNDAVELGKLLSSITKKLNDK